MFCHESDSSACSDSASAVLNTAIGATTAGEMVMCEAVAAGGERATHVTKLCFTPRPRRRRACLCRSQAGPSCRRQLKSVAAAAEAGETRGRKNPKYRLGLSRQTSADKHAAKLPIGNQFVLRSVQTIFSHPCRAQAAQSFVMCVALFPPPPLPRSPFHRIVVRQIVQIMLRH